MTESRVVPLAFRQPRGRGFVRVAGALLALLAGSAGGRDLTGDVVLIVQVRNTSARVVPQAHLRVPVPVDNEYQDVSAVRLAPAEIGRRRIPAGGEVAFFEFRDLAPGDSAWAIVSARLRTREYRPTRSVLRHAIPKTVERLCLGPSAKLDPRALAVRELAARLAPDSRDPRIVVQAFVDHLVTGFQYELDEHQEDALTVLAARRGSCSELSRLLVALCRARGIPARLVSGSRLRAPLERGYVDTVHHRWVEAFLPHYGWYPVDISMAVNRADPTRRVGVIPPGRLILLRNAGLEADALQSADLTLLTPAAALERTVRCYWLPLHQASVRQTTHWLREVLSTPDGFHADSLHRGLLQQPGVATVPFLGMALHEPVAGANPTAAVAALAATRSRLAVVPLVDVAGQHLQAPDPVVAALAALTGQRETSGGYWRWWLYGPGQAFLRGESPTASVVP